jgi:hypothetical protein
MRSPMTLTMGLVAGLVLGFSLHTPSPALRTSTQAMDAASRDGSYQARLDIENGRKPRLAIGRWSTDEDRALFITGYEGGYQEAYKARIGGQPKADAAELAGYRQGLSDGRTDHAASQPFRPDKTNNYSLSVVQASLQGNQGEEKYRQEYRIAYVNGYQEGYYSQQKAPQWSYYAQ